MRGVEGPADAALPRASLARLALSAAAKAVADRATWLVPTRVEAVPSIAEAAHLVSEAQDVLTRAVVYARESGASWTEISTALDVTRQAAHLRFKDAVRRWQDALDEPRTAGDAGLRCELPDGFDMLNGASLLDQFLRHLDLWCRRHINPEIELRQGFPVPLGSGSQMVSGTLPRHTDQTRRAVAERYRRHREQER